MRGKRAKYLRRMAAELVIRDGAKGLGEGYNEYHQAMNMIQWGPQLDESGLPMLDPEGMALMKPDKFPGTITNAWKWRVMYRTLKRMWKRNGNN